MSGEITLIHDPKSLHEQISVSKKQGNRVGLVPTMGALHEGHLNLVRRSLSECDETVVSIFVNPTQFAPNEDFEKYPRTLDHDCKLLERLGKVTVFAPAVNDIYPERFNTYVEIGGVTEQLEGASRPTHFRGVATVVLKLFMISGADVGYFGQKDLQQCVVIQKMATDLNLPVEIKVCPTVRESDGLAMSSRNKYLSPTERQEALVLVQSLELAKRRYRMGQKCTEIIKLEMSDLIQSVSSAKIDYIAFVDPETFAKRDKIVSPQTAVLLAVRIGNTRLIDNTVIE